MNRMLNRMLESPARVDSTKKLTDMLEKLVKLEREAFGIGIDKGDEGSGIEALLEKLGRS